MDNLQKIITYIHSNRPKSKAEFDRARQKICAKLKIPQPPNHELLKAYQKLVKNKRVKPNKQFEYFLRKAGIRTLSGIAIVTSLTKPYKCPGKCAYCPAEAKMPKSYLASEPAAARALGLKFDPYEQMRRRILMLEQNGHPTDKIEYIIKGGTWNSYPLKYQYWFVLRSFEACNEMGKNKIPAYRQGRQDTRYKQFQISNFKFQIEDLQKKLQQEQKKNESARHRIIGLTLETRPDAVTPQTIYHMRQMGATRIELGLQAPDDKILKLVNRGHTVQQFKDAMFLLRQAGFKVDLHFMPDLPGTTPKHDVEMYKKIFSDPGLKPDMVKIYPCSVLKTAELYKWYKSGKYKPYSNLPSSSKSDFGMAKKQLLEALIKMKLATPRYCRISRLIRDIPENEIEAGNRITNLREELKKEMAKRGLKCQCLRCREVGHNQNFKFQISNFKLFTEKYQTTGGTEYFLSYEDKKRQVVFAFLRLRLPHVIASPAQAGRSNPNVSGNTTGIASSANANWLPRNDIAFIRELHTYGQLVSVGKNEKRASQHKGLGKKLVKEAEKIARKKFTLLNPAFCRSRFLPKAKRRPFNRVNKIAVISGVGVRDYYRKLGYRLQNTYMVKNLQAACS